VAWGLGHPLTLRSSLENRGSHQRPPPPASPPPSAACIVSGFKRVCPRANSLNARINLLHAAFSVCSAFNCSWPSPPPPPPPSPIRATGMLGHKIIQECSSCCSLKICSSSSELKGISHRPPQWLLWRRAMGMIRLKIRQECSICFSLKVCSSSSELKDSSQLPPQTLHPHIKGPPDDASALYRFHCVCSMAHRVSIEFIVFKEPPSVVLIVKKAHLSYLS